MKKKRRAGKVILDKFSVDLILKIFIKIPVKSLLKLRCVSKSWCKIIDDPLFAQMQYDCGEAEQNTVLLRSTYLRRSSKTILYAAQSYHGEEARMIHAATVPMVKFPAINIYASSYGCCKGLLYIVERSTGRIVVSNPLISQFTILPPMHLEMDNRSSNLLSTAIGLGFDNLAKTFKMIFSRIRSSASYCTLVHTLGTTSWREVPSVPAYYCNKADYKSVFVHGFLHWMIDPSMIENSRGRILAFDISNEKFEVIPHPKLCFEKNPIMLFRLLDIKGNLGMLDLSRDTKIDIWVMDYEKHLWAKECAIDITIVGKIHVCVTQCIGLWKQDEILFDFCDQDFLTKYWSYSMRTGNMKECEHRSSEAQAIQVYSLKGSLISIYGAQEVSWLNCTG